MMLPEAREARGAIAIRTLVLLAVGAAALRMGWALAVPVMPVSDSGVYDQFAVSLAEGRGYAWPSGQLTAYWPVGTSALIGLGYWIFGQSYGVVVGINLVLGVATVVLGAMLSGRWFGGRTGVATGVLLAIWPSQIQFTTVINSEQPFVAAMLGAWQAGICFGGRLGGGRCWPACSSRRRLTFARPGCCCRWCC